jgi:hypothetical protein
MVKILSLDISSKTGWSVGIAYEDKYELQSYGQIPKVEKPKLDYPHDYVSWAVQIAKPIIDKIRIERADVIVIEETTKSQNNFSQKILEFTHYLVAEYIIQNGLKSRYFMVGEWREAVGARQTGAESKQNKLSKKIKDKTGKKIAKDENGKVLGKITKKHVNVRRVKEIFNLDFKLKDNDTCDGILLGYAYYQYTFKNFKRKNSKDE